MPLLQVLVPGVPARVTSGGLSELGTRHWSWLFFSRIPVLPYLSTTMVSIGGIYFSRSTLKWCRSQWPRGLRRRSAAARLLRSWVQIPPEAWIFVCCECRVLSGRGLCDELNTRPEESYRLWCVVVCDLETSRMRRPWPALGRSATANKTLKW